jgi:hypothetical protein
VSRRTLVKSGSSTDCLCQLTEANLLLVSFLSTWFEDRELILHESTVCNNGIRSEFRVDY